MAMDLQQHRVVVMPDLFLDVLVPLPAWDEVQPQLATVAQRGGGNVPVGTIEFRPGGNAANLALALARMGVQVDLIARTDALGMHMVRDAARGLPLSLDLVQEDAAAATVALETVGANVMLSHAGPVAAFGPERLDAAAWDAIETADAVAVVNWSQNRRGTDLLDAVAARASGFFYLDTGDPRHRPDALDLLGASFWSSLDAWGLNENELRAFAGDGELMASARALADRLDVRLDLHTRTMAYSISGQETTQVAADPTPAKRLTGAGDAWNAGNLAGYLLHLPAQERLRLAHQSATRHVAPAAVTA